MVAATVATTVDQQGYYLLLASSTSSYFPASITALYRSSSSDLTHAKHQPSAEWSQFIKCGIVTRFSPPPLLIGSLQSQHHA